jgi:hypothetical protein
MSPTIFSPGSSAVKSRLTKSGIGPAWPSCSVSEQRQGFGWHGLRPSSQGGADEFGASSPRHRAPEPCACAGDHTPRYSPRISPYLQFQEFASFADRAERPGPPFAISGFRHGEPVAHLEDTGSVFASSAIAFSYSASMNEYFSLTAAFSRTTRLLLGRRLPFRVPGSAAPAPVSGPGTACFPESAYLLIFILAPVIAHPAAKGLAAHVEFPATFTVGSEFSMTLLTAYSLNSGVKRLGRPGNFVPFLSG